jgi:uncharacterized protein (TIGR01244 family)
MSLDDIYNFLQVDERTLTAGQPTRGQLRAAAEAGVQVVINLSTGSERFAPEEEAALARQLGLEYHHIPVVWDSPQPADFEQFASVMAAAGDKKALIHCAANYRVTAFYSLYAMRALGWTAEQAEKVRGFVWERGQYPIWDAFIDRMQAEIAAQA